MYKNYFSGKHKTEEEGFRNWGKWYVHKHKFVGAPVCVFAFQD